MRMLVPGVSCKGKGWTGYAAAGGGGGRKVYAKDEAGSQNVAVLDGVAWKAGGGESASVNTGMNDGGGGGRPIIGGYSGFGYVGVVGMAGLQYVNSVSASVSGSASVKGDILWRHWRSRHGHILGYLGRRRVTRNIARRKHTSRTLGRTGDRMSWG